MLISACNSVYCAIWEGDVLSTTIAQENGDHVTPNEVRGTGPIPHFVVLRPKKSVPLALLRGDVLHIGVLSETVGFSVKKHRVRCIYIKSDGRVHERCA